MRSTSLLEVSIIRKISRQRRTFIRRNGVIFDKGDASKTSTEEQEIINYFQNNALPKRLSKPCVLSTTRWRHTFSFHAAIIGTLKTQKAGSAVR